MLTHTYERRRLTFKKNVLNRNYRAADERFFCTKRYACVQFGQRFRHASHRRTTGLSMASNTLKPQRHNASCNLQLSGFPPAS